MSSTENPKYCVFLKSGLPPQEESFFRHLCFEINSNTESSLLYFQCAEIDVSHHSYIEMKIHLPSSEELWTLRVQHHYILSIDGSDSQRPIGFYSAS